MFRSSGTRLQAGFQLPQRLTAVASLDDIVAVQPQQLGEPRPGGGLVVDEENRVAVSRVPIG